MHPHIFISATQADYLFACDEEGTNFAVDELATRTLSELLGGQRIEHKDVAYNVPNVFSDPNVVTRNCYCEIGEYADLQCYIVATATFGSYVVEFLLEY